MSRGHNAHRFHGSRNCIITEEMVFCMDGHLVWDIDPVLFSVGSFAVRYYSLCWLAAFASCYFVMRSIFRRERLSTDNLESLLIYVFIGIFVGARLGHCLFYETHFYLTHPWRIVLPLYERGDGSWGFGFMGWQATAPPSA